MERKGREGEHRGGVKESRRGEEVSRFLWEALRRGGGAQMAVYSQDPPDNRKYSVLNTSTTEYFYTAIWPGTNSFRPRLSPHPSLSLANPGSGLLWTIRSENT